MSGLAVSGRLYLPVPPPVTVTTLDGGAILAEVEAQYDITERRIKAIGDARDTLERARKEMLAYHGTAPLFRVTVATAFLEKLLARWNDRLGEHEKDLICLMAGEGTRHVAAIVGDVLGEAAAAEVKNGSDEEGEWGE